MQCPGALHAFREQAAQTQRAMRLNNAVARSHSPRLQNLVDSGKKPVAVVEHGAIESGACIFVDLPREQGLQIQPDRCYRSLELMRDCVDEGIVLLVSSDLPHQKDGIQHDAADDQREQQDPEKQEDPCVPVEKTQPT